MKKICLFMLSVIMIMTILPTAVFAKDSKDTDKVNEETEINLDLPDLTDKESTAQEDTTGGDELVIAPAPTDSANPKTGDSLSLILISGMAVLLLGASLLPVAACIKKRK